MDFNVCSWATYKNIKPNLHHKVVVMMQLEREGELYIRALWKKARIKIKQITTNNGVPSNMMDHKNWLYLNHIILMIKGGSHGFIIMKSTIWFPQMKSFNGLTHFNHLHTALNVNRIGSQDPIQA